MTKKKYLTPATTAVAGEPAQPLATSIIEAVAASGLDTNEKIMYDDQTLIEVWKEAW